MGPSAALLSAALLLSTAALPAAEFSTYIGDANPYTIAKLVVDAAGNTIVAGSRSFNLSYDPLNPRWMAGAFAMRLDPSGRKTALAGFSGKGNDFANDVALDAAGNIYIAGLTSSPDFTGCSGLQFTTGPGFIAKFSPDGSRLLYCTYFPEIVVALAVDAPGNMYVTGTTYKRTFPTTPGLPAGGVTSGVPMVSGAYLTKIAAAGDRIVYSTVLSGIEKSCGCCSSCFTSSRSSVGWDVAVDAAGSAYIVGTTDTLDLPTTPGALAPRGPGAFVGKVNTAGTALVYLTYIGSGNLAISPNSYPANRAGAIAVDSAGNAYVAGSTFDPQFPATAGAYQTTLRGRTDMQDFNDTDAFVLKLNPTGTAVVWATYLGGKGRDSAVTVALDPAGNVWLSGGTDSADFPNAQGWTTGNEFIVELNPSGATLIYSAEFPGGSAERVALGPTGLLHVAGSAGVVSAVAPSARPAMRAFGVANAAWGKLGGRIAAGEVISLYGPHIGPAAPVSQPNTSGSVPNFLGGVQVFVNDIPAPLLYVSDSQINAVAPFGIRGESSARIRITNNGTAGPDFTATVVAEDPQVFQRLDGSAAAVNSDGSINSPEHPAKPGSAMTIWVTGTNLGPLALNDGEIPSQAQPYLRPRVLYGSTDLYVDYMGAAPGLVTGVAQINFRLPANFQTGNICVVSGSAASNWVLVFAEQAGESGQ